MLRQRNLPQSEVMVATSPVLSVASGRCADTAGAVAPTGEPVCGGGGVAAAGARTPQHGPSSKKMALITSDYGIMRSLGTKWP